MLSPTRKPILLALLACAACLLSLSPVASGQADSLAAARHARDQADVAALQAAVKQADAHAAQAKSAAAYIEVAQLDAWLCEAAQGHNQQDVVKQAANAGAEAAQQAITLAPNSSEAYRLRGSLLGQVMSTGGMMAGMRYGSESSSDLDKAIQLDPKSARAYRDRGIAYIYTPAMFGGSYSNAIAELQKAIALEPGLDSAHDWLAQAYINEKQPAAAMKEAQIAEKLHPGRSLTRHMEQQAAALEAQHAH
ncbi:MAG: hypothetical protein ACRD1L_07455 [Terriglobales bacterium]